MPGNIAEVDPGADRGRRPVPVDALDIGKLRLVPARSEIGEGIVEPARAEFAHDPVLFLVVVVAVGVDQQSQRGPFPLRGRWEDEQSSLIAHGCRFGDEHIDRAAFPTLVFVEGAAGLLQTHFLGVLVGALHERLDVLCRAHGPGADRAIGASQRFGIRMVGESRSGGQQN